MSSTSLLSAIDHHYHPSLFFCLGLLLSIATCVMAFLVATSFRSRETGLGEPSLRSLNYQRFRNELVTLPRHLGFSTGEVQELQDHEFDPDQG